MSAIAINDRAAGRAVGVATPLLDVGRAQNDESVAQGDGLLDMMAIIRAIEARIAAMTGSAADEAPSESV